MSKRLYVFLAVLMVVSMALSACGAAGGAPDACKADTFGCTTIKAGQTIKIGMGGPMTGDNAAFGLDSAQAARIAIQDAGQLNGFSFELDAQDDGGTPEGGAAVANKFVSDPQIAAIEGHVFSGATGAAMPIYEKAGLVMLSGSATNPDLTKKGSPVFNRGVFTDAVQGKFVAEYIYNTMKFTKVVIMHDSTTYGQGLAEVVRDELKTLGTEALAFQAIVPGESDYSSVLADMASKSPEIIFYGGYAAEAVVLINQMNAAGLTNTILFGGDGIYGADLIDRTKANSEGDFAASLVPPASDAVTKYNAAYEAAYGEKPGKLSPYSWTAYDAAAVLVKAIKEVAIVGSDGNLYIPRSALIAAVRGTKDYKGLSGMISCDATGECGSSGPVFYVVKNGEWVEAPK
jgi:branched-chain amino acid transport system substrate-binding protein